MATSAGGHLNSTALEESGPLVAGIGVYTVALTTAFVGMVALASGNATGFLGRLPVYVLASSVAFVGVLIAVDGPRQAGSTALVLGAVAGAGEFLLVTLATEGMVYAMTDPGAVVASHLFVYLLSAAVIASGLSYWGVQHWRDLGGVVSASGL